MYTAFWALEIYVNMAVAFWGPTMTALGHRFSACAAAIEARRSRATAVLMELKTP